MKYLRLIVDGTPVCTLVSNSLRPAEFDQVAGRASESGQPTADPVGGAGVHRGRRHGAAVHHHPPPPTVRQSHANRLSLVRLSPYRVSTKSSCYET